MNVNYSTYLPLLSDSSTIDTASSALQEMKLMKPYKYTRNTNKVYTRLKLFLVSSSSNQSISHTVRTHIKC